MKEREGIQNKMRQNKVIQRIAVSFVVLGLLFSMGCGKKTPEYLEVEVYPTADYWATMDLSDTLFPTKEACEELSEQYLQDAAKLLHMEGWWIDVNPEATRLELDIQIGSSAQSFTFAPAVFY